MRFCIYTDVHFSEYSSILRSQGDNFSTRLEALIKSINWAEQEAINNHCDEIICLGDFFDKPDLNSRELTALKEINWAKIPHTFLVGNHEASVKSLKYNSVTALQNNGFNIIDTPTLRTGFGYQLLLLPYIIEEDRISLHEYVTQTSKGTVQTDEFKQLFVLSHNDIKGIQYGAFTSKEGFEITEIENSCTLFLNGHLHNGSKFCKNGFNLGNLSGQNFSEDAFEYQHCVFILDTDINTLDSIENPYAFNFYKIDYDESFDSRFDDLKNNAVLSLKCPEHLRDRLLEKVTHYNDKIIEKRLMISRSANYNQESLSAEDLTMDHLSKFVEFCKEKISNSELLDYELREVCK